MSNKQLTGLCGEHYVAALLAGHEMVVALPRGGAERSDLFVADCNRGRAIRVQVKSGRQSYYKYKKKFDGQGCFSWHTDRSIIESNDKDLWFAFVFLGDWPKSKEIPIVFFIPSTFVAEQMSSQTQSNGSYFWMFESELEPYRNENGIQRVKDEVSK